MQSVLLSDGYDKLHPLVKQALLEHHNAHLERLQGNALAVAGQGAAPGPGGPPPPQGDEEDPNETPGDKKPGDTAPTEEDPSAPSE
jgi:hypothetical protein